ncbi:MAG: CopD family protein [Gammaproteobacteria bacterium]|nr:MAG: CopD family protein [Gammaproteobacteria bacterium]
MAWVKALHLIFMTAWFAGLFYLPRLFVYHAMTTDAAGNERFKVMERKLFFFITPWAILTILLGLWMLWDYAWALYSHQVWLHTKLFLVLLLIAYHLYCYKLMLDFKHERNRRSHTFYRWVNEAPVLLLFTIVILAVVKPL